MLDSRTGHGECGRERWPDRRIALVALTGLAYLVWQLVSPDDEAWTTTVEHVLYTGVSLVAVAVVGCGLCRGRGPGTPAVVGIAAYLSLIAVGNTVWLYREGIRGQEMPFPSTADAAYLFSNVPLFLGIMLLPTRPMSLLMRGRVLLDGLLSLAAVAGFSWFFCFGPMLLDAQTPLVDRLIGVGYPVADLLMLSYVFLLACQSGSPRVRRPLRAVQAGLLLAIAGDSYFGVGLVQGFYDANDPVSGLWVTGYLLMAVGAHDLAAMPNAVTGDSNTEAPRTAPRWPAAMLPYALVLAAAGLFAFVWMTPGDSGLATGVYVSTTCVIVLVLLRQVFAIHENLRLYGELEAAYRQVELLATTDGMTGLLNHRVFRDRLDAAVTHAIDTAQPLALLLLDVDHFKRFNDTSGHLAGDEVLRRLATVLRETVRAEDVPARYGGEEFVAILPRASETVASEVAERVREAIARRSAPLAITVSVGVSCLGAAGATAGTLIDAADRALYEAKRAGRNRVCTARPLNDATRIA